MTSSRFETYTFVELSRLNLKRLFGPWLPLISGFLLPRREEKGRGMRGGKGRVVGEKKFSRWSFDDGSIRLIRLVRLVIGDLKRKCEGLTILTERIMKGW